MCVCVQLPCVPYRGMWEVWIGSCVMHMTSSRDQCRNAVHAGIGLPHTQTPTTHQGGTPGVVDEVTGKILNSDTRSTTTNVTSPGQSGDNSGTRIKDHMYTKPTNFVLSDHYWTTLYANSTTSQDLNLKTTCLQRPPFLGPLGGLYRQVLLYAV